MSTQARRNPRVSLHDVAAAAGVSLATASRALSATGKAHSHTHERVRHVASELGYLANGAARALRSRNTHLIGAVLPTLDYAIYSSQVAALQRTLAENGYSLLVTSSGYDYEEELSQARILIERGVEGLVLIGGNHHPGLVTLTQELGIPCIDTYVYHGDSDRSCIGFDNRHASGRAIRHLIDLGHTHIAMIAGVTRNNDRAGDRVAGVRETLLAHGLAFPDEYLLEAPYTLAAGREAFRRLMLAQPAPTAVFCGSDILAFGALAECARQGIKVPADVSIIGFDNLDFCQYFVPGLTTVEVPATEMGAGAARYLIARIAGAHGTECIELEANLILRGTTAPPPGRHDF